MASIVRFIRPDITGSLLRPLYPALIGGNITGFGGNLIQRRTVGKQFVSWRGAAVIAQLRIDAQIGKLTAGEVEPMLVIGIAKIGPGETLNQVVAFGGDIASDIRSCASRVGGNERVFQSNICLAGLGSFQIDASALRGGDIAIDGREIYHPLSSFGINATAEATLAPRYRIAGDRAVGEIKIVARRGGPVYKDAAALCNVIAGVGRIASDRAAGDRERSHIANAAASCSGLIGGDRIIGDGAAGDGQLPFY